MHESETIRGRTFKLCGLTGVNIRLLDCGITTGPPQLNEYPVDPVGVAMINPSAQYEFKNSPSMYVCTVIMDEVSCFNTVTSFKP